MNWVWTGIHKHPKNNTWPTPTFLGTYEVRGVHELVMSGHSWTPKKTTWQTPKFHHFKKILALETILLLETILPLKKNLTTWKCCSLPMYTAVIISNNLTWNKRLLSPVQTAFLLEQLAFTRLKRLYPQNKRLSTYSLTHLWLFWCMLHAPSVQ